MSKTPLIDTLKKLNHERYHMPGHKGKKPEGFPCSFEIDFTEISKTGNLFLADGPIFESEELYKSYFGAKQCIYLTGGSTQGILTAVFTVKPKKMLCDRNSHKALCHALGINDVKPIFVYPKINTQYDIPDVISPCDIEQKLNENKDIEAVFITSPNYYGIYSDIEAISKICKNKSVKLIVDEAHGCHFPAINIKNAIMCGADIAITSAHKTTDSLGGGAVLLCASDTMPLRKNASIFGSSSPSYLIMASIEMALKNIDMYDKMPKICDKLRDDIEKTTKFQVIKHKNLDFCRITVNTKNVNISGVLLHEILEEKYDIIPEMSDNFNVVFIITYRDEKLEYLLKSLQEISKTLKYTTKTEQNYKIIKPKRAISVREAMFSNEILVDLEDAKNKISRQIIAPYPPGVPIIYFGEIILPEHIEYIKNMCYNDYEKICIVDK